MKARFIPVAMAALACQLPCHALVSEPTSVIVVPEQTILWATATNSVVSLPVIFPAGATAATLTVSGATYSQTYADLTPGSFDLTLPAATSHRNEDVYELGLTFNDPAHTVRTARLGVIAGLDTGGRGTTRCLAPADTHDWRWLRSRALVMVPFGTTSLTMAINDEPAATLDTGLGGAAGWYLLRPGVRGTVALTLSVDGADIPATLNALGDETILLLR